MPIYLYQVVETGEVIEVEHSVNDVAPTQHPETGQALQRIYTAPNLSNGYSSQNSKKILSNESLQKGGFTKYVRDPVTRRYNREVGNFGPSQLRPHG